MTTLTAAILEGDRGLFECESSQFEYPVRVVRSLETSTVRRRLADEDQKMISEWIWATDIPQTVAGTKAIIHIGHARWRIENNGFNELVNEWNADHVYKHEPHATDDLVLTTFPQAMQKPVISLSQGILCLFPRISLPKSRLEAMR